VYICFIHTYLPALSDLRSLSICCTCITSSLYTCMHVHTCNLQPRTYMHTIRIHLHTHTHSSRIVLSLFPHAFKRSLYNMTQESWNSEHWKEKDHIRESDLQWEEKQNSISRTDFIWPQTAPDSRSMSSLFDQLETKYFCLGVWPVSNTNSSFPGNLEQSSALSTQRDAAGVDHNIWAVLSLMVEHASIKLGKAG
jgi:hypothetical protein